MEPTLVLPPVIDSSGTIERLVRVPGSPALHERWDSATKTWVRTGARPSEGMFTEPRASAAELFKAGVPDEGARERDQAMAEGISKLFRENPDYEVPY